MKALRTQSGAGCASKLIALKMERDEINFVRACYFFSTLSLILKWMTSEKIC